MAMEVALGIHVDSIKASSIWQRGVMLSPLLTRGMFEVAIHNNFRARSNGTTLNLSVLHRMAFNCICGRARRRPPRSMSKKSRARTLGTRHQNRDSMYHMLA